MTENEISARFEEDWRTWVAKTRIHEKVSPAQMPGVRAIFRDAYLAGVMFGADVGTNCALSAFVKLIGSSGASNA